MSIEHRCRYVATGPIALERALERLSVDGDGLVVYPLKHPFRDGTTHVLFESLDFGRSRHRASHDISAFMHVITRILELRLMRPAPAHVHRWAPRGTSRCVRAC